MVVSALFCPPLVAVAALSAVLGPQAYGPPGWVALGLGPGVPLGFTVWLRLSGRIQALFSARPQDRIAPLLLGGVSCCLGAWILLDVSVVASMLLLVYGTMSIVLVPLTRVTLVSLHAAGAASTAFCFALWQPSFAPVAFGVAVAVSWARLELRAHTVQQVAAGSAVGVVIPVLLHVLNASGSL